jgi:hypothetical protein
MDIRVPLEVILFNEKIRLIAIIEQKRHCLRHYLTHFCLHIFSVIQRNCVNKKLRGGHSIVNRILVFQNEMDKHG